MLTAIVTHPVHQAIGRGVRVILSEGWWVSATTIQVGSFKVNRILIPNTLVVIAPCIRPVKDGDRVDPDTGRSQSGLGLDVALFDG